jgi:DNA-binding MarR family transcriptional regulator
MSDFPPSDAAVRAWTRLMRAQSLALSAIEADLKRGGFPPLGWYDLLLEVLRGAPDGLRPYEIETRLLLAQHNVSRLIDRVAAAGYAERRPCAEDGRGHRVHITEAGRDLLTRMWPVYGAAIQRHIGDKLGENAGGLADLLERVIGAQLPT